MRVNTLCFTWGLSAKDMKACHRAYLEMNPDAVELNLIPISQETLSQTVRDVIDEHQTKPMGPPGDHEKSAAEVSRVILMHTEKREQILEIMKSFKSAMANRGDLIFAMITETALSWTFQYYLDHVIEEHEYMKSHRPEDVPDMKPM
jgi:hypothetical protein